MPHIMLTYRCNLHCSYCFANEFVNRDKTDITLRNFVKAVSFITRTGETNIGLIGGEPLLHPGFQTFMELLTANPKVKSVTLYTNGLLMDRYLPQITDAKVTTLVNCNSPKAIGEKAFANMRQNLDLLFFEKGMTERIGLGINLYSDDMDYSYMLDLLQRYNKHEVRISLTVPDFSKCSETNSLEHFRKRKRFLMEFIRNMDSIQVVPYYDCNVPPYCIWDAEEKKWLEEYVARYSEIKTNLTDYHSKCFPPIDILPDLHAVRCFGMSDFMKVPIGDFRNVSDLTSYFLNEIDSSAYRLPACEECGDCYEQKTSHCITGCMGFKASRIHAYNEAIKGI